MIQTLAARSNSVLSAPATSLRRVRVSIRSWIASPITGSRRAWTPAVFSPGVLGVLASTAACQSTWSAASSNMRSRDVRASGRARPAATFDSSLSSRTPNPSTACRTPPIEATLAADKPFSVIRFRMNAFTSARRISVKLRPPSGRWMWFFQTLRSFWMVTARFGLRRPPCNPTSAALQYASARWSSVSPVFVCSRARSRAAARSPTGSSPSCTATRVVAAFARASASERSG